MAGIRAVIFDLDGTLVDVPYDWPKIWAELETGGKPVLSYLNSLTGPERSRKWAMLERIEKEATEKAVLKEGIPQLLDFLARASVRRALVTNNSRENVSLLLRKFNLEFDCVICRESGLWKPSGAPLLAALEEMGVQKEDCCVVGDSHFDIRAGEEAGIGKVFILRRADLEYSSTSAKIVDSVEELKESIQKFLMDPPFSKHP